MTRALIVGPVCEGLNSKNGQTNKLIQIKLLLERNYSQVEVFSTYRITKKPFRFFALLSAVRKADDVWLVLSRNGSKWLGPLLTLLLPQKKYFYTNVGIGTLLIEYEQGGYAESEVSMTDYLKKPNLWKKSKSKRLIRFYSSCTKIYVESDLMKRNFEAVYGLDNVSYLSNFRELAVSGFDRSMTKRADMTNFIFLSRIVPCKGIASLIEAAAQLKEEGISFSIDLFGPVGLREKEWFQSVLQKADKSVVRYMGEERGDVLKRLSGYDFLVFPTESTEGMPGVVVEALFAGTPIVSSDFSYASELIKDGKTGIIYPFTSKGGLVEAMKRACNVSPEKWRQMSSDCKRDSSRYSIGLAEKIIRKDLFNDED